MTEKELFRIKEQVIKDSATGLTIGFKARMVTAIPHIRVEPHSLKPLGQRLKSKMKTRYKEANILDLLEHDYSLSGETVQSWPIDFHWWIKRNDHTEQVYIVTVDLDVIDALVKAAKITTLALDAKSSLEYDKLRIVPDSSSGTMRS